MELHEQIDAFALCENLVMNIHRTGTGMACKKNRNKKRLEIVVLQMASLEFNFLKK